MISFSFILPVHFIKFFSKMIARSAILIIVSLSWLIVIAVAPNSDIIFFINLFIKFDEDGSRPAVGSSKI